MARAQLRREQSFEGVSGSPEDECKFEENEVGTRVSSTTVREKSLPGCYATGSPREHHRETVFCACGSAPGDLLMSENGFQNGNADHAAGAPCL